MRPRRRAHRYRRHQRGAACRWMLGRSHLAAHQQDHKAEDQMWISWMNNIANRVSKIDGVKDGGSRGERALQSQPGTVKSRGIQRS